MGALRPLQTLGSSVPYRTMTKKTSPWMVVAARPHAPRMSTIVSCRLRKWNITAHHEEQTRVSGAVGCEAEREDTDDGHAPGRPRLTRMPPAARMAGPTRATRHPCPWRGPTLGVLRLRGLCARPGGRQIRRRDAGRCSHGRLGNGLTESLPNPEACTSPLLRRYIVATVKKSGDGIILDLLPLVFGTAVQAISGHIHVV